MRLTHWRGLYPFQLVAGGRGRENTEWGISPQSLLAYASALSIQSQGRTIRSPVMTDVMTDRRDSPRYALTLVAIVTELGNANVVNARSSDVSRSGCYVDTLQPLAPGAQ